jgi:cytochrome oxidase Cu insertion factor (SCO1/SenC/PrrC family)
VPLARRFCSPPQRKSAPAPRRRRLRPPRQPPRFPRAIAAGSHSARWTTRPPTGTSQQAIGKPVGDHVLLDRQGRPKRLADYRGKPLLVNFIYTACFHVCPTTTRNLQKAVQNTVAVLGTDRFNIVSIGFNQPFDSPEAMKAFATQYGIHLPNWEFLSPAPAIVDD